jgi:hypothetical protein
MPAKLGGVLTIELRYANTKILPRLAKLASYLVLLERKRIVTTAFSFNFDFS